MSEPRTYYVPPPPDWGGVIKILAVMLPFFIVGYVVFCTGKSRPRGDEETQIQQVADAKNYHAPREHKNSPLERDTPRPSSVPGMPGESPKDILQQGQDTPANADPVERQRKDRGVWSQGLISKALDAFGVSGWRRLMASILFVFPLGFVTLGVLAICGHHHVSIFPVLIGLAFCHILLWGWPDRLLEWGAMGGLILIAGSGLLVFRE